MFTISTLQDQKTRIGKEAFIGYGSAFAGILPSKGSIGNGSHVKGNFPKDTHIGQNCHIQWLLWDKSKENIAYFHTESDVSLVYLKGDVSELLGLFIEHHSTVCATSLSGYVAVGPFCNIGTPQMGVTLDNVKVPTRLTYTGPHLGGEYTAVALTPTSSALIQKDANGAVEILSPTPLTPDVEQALKRLFATMVDDEKKRTQQLKSELGRLRGVAPPKGPTQQEVDTLRAELTALRDAFWRHVGQPTQR